MIICFTGHRDCLCDELRLAGLQLDYPGAKWIHGGAKTGFDKQVHDHIVRNDIPFEVYRPEYDKYPPKVAPIMRNHKMIDLLQQGDLLVSCWDGRPVGGTYDTITYAISKHVPIKALDVARHIKLAKGKVL